MGQRHGFTHVLHRRFAQARCCPLCRTEAYQKRLVHDGKEAHKLRSARLSCVLVMSTSSGNWLSIARWYRPAAPTTGTVWLHASAMQLVSNIPEPIFGGDPQLYVGSKSFHHHISTRELLLCNVGVLPKYRLQ